MKKFASLIATVALFCAPAIALADSLIPMGPTPEQLLSRQAFMNAVVQGTSVACVVQTSATQVRLNQSYRVWWGSFGSNGVGWAPVGSYTIMPSKEGIYEFKLTFHAADGTSATCKTDVAVTA